VDVKRPDRKGRLFGDTRRGGVIDALLVLIVVLAVWVRTPVGAFGDWAWDKVTGQEAQLSLLDRFATQISADAETVALVEATVVAASLEPVPEGAFPEPYRSAARITLVAEGEDEDERIAELDLIHRGNPEATLEIYAIGEEAMDRAVSRARSAGVQNPESYDNHRRYLNRMDTDAADRVVSETLGAASMMSLAWPVDDSWRVSSKYGFRTHPISGKKRLHNGVDVAVPEGTPVRSAQSGTVTVSSEDNINGKYIVIDHGHGVKTSYCHLSELEVERGDELQRNDPIGLSGTTGRSTGPHLHFVLRVGRDSVDPERFRPVPAPVDPPVPTDIE
jgi:murein DD-endopeptidase MepM/ murein hydrolase activator NlpD